jgi:hypothetical protein
MRNPLPVLLLGILLTGSVDDSTVTATSLIRHTLSPGDVSGDVSYADTLITNGGDLSVNKNLGFDSTNQTVNGYNLQSEKIMTYLGRDGAHLSGEENMILDTTGSYNPDSVGYIQCVFTHDDTSWFPAFCNTIQLKALLINVHSAQVSEKGNLRAGGPEDTPAELMYQIAVTPDSGHGEIAAGGIVKTEFSGSAMEARNASGNGTAANQWKDVTGVSGDLTSFIKNFEYRSGFRI